ncbi:prepilin peptidase [Aquibacillus sp. 3ASR75-11]|uniref:Prepilin peptidase n=1 Tax=Terrihalobacillus insolitus TaxID=2950438 RepID=A0A9X4AMW3_9BACI|nr:A24 family peptidase [Terrihalobacillus insolitus]MDC3412475.1 prepilin peptidase [Terrihalobacillus insolitus]MDC3423895.1 prepilin peptidase [Terrihalobacillus insolitus]
MNLVFLFYFFVLGLGLGSFYNVVGLRVPVSTFLKNKRSICPNCFHSLSWYELIPVLSFLIQRGSCRHCDQSISRIYPFIELFTGFFFVYSFYIFGFRPELAVALTFVSLMSIVFVTDITYMLIPDRILFFFLPIFLFLRILVPLEPWWSAFLGASIGLLMLASVIVISRGGMGGGDMKLVGLFGLVLGVKGVLLAFFLACIYGTCFHGLQWIVNKQGRKKPIPFGPYLVMGALTAYFYGEMIITWYVRTFLTFTL